MENDDWLPISKQKMHSGYAVSHSRNRTGRQHTLKRSHIFKFGHSRRIQSFSITIGWFSNFQALNKWLEDVYWRAPISSASEDVTAFILAEGAMSGTYAWTTMPQGLKCAPAQFCRLVQESFAFLESQGLFWYLDAQFKNGESEWFQSRSSFLKFLRTLLMI